VAAISYGAIRDGVIHSFSLHSPCVQLKELQEQGRVYVYVCVRVCLVYVRSGDLMYCVWQIWVFKMLDSWIWLLSV
jgi:hypothetical protein